jgi:hypothetical protein
MATIDCICPPKADGETRHPGGDTINLRPKLDLRRGLAVRNNVLRMIAEDPDADNMDVLTAMSEAYVLEGIESWTLVDAKGKPIPVTRTAIRELVMADLAVGAVVSAEADPLYADATVPLVLKAFSSSPTSPTEPSTSVTTTSSPRPRKPRKRSSTSTTRTDGIVTITRSPGSDSNSSQSLAPAG